jgi:hypothetical protein
LNAIVTGGKTNNEMPEEYTLKYAADIYLQSYYGSRMSALIFPLGLPTVLSFSTNEARITLGEFLESWESELVPNLYTITVCGELNFNQDLIFSRVISKRSLDNFYSKENYFKANFE